MEKMKKNRKAAEKIMSVYWFAILFIVAAAVVYMVASFYGKPYEVRGIESGLLADKAADCISYAGYLRDGVLTDDFKNNLLEKCGITFNVEDTFDWKQQPQYFLKLDFYDFSSYPNSDPIFEASAGNQNFQSFCGLKGNKLPVCLERELYVLSKDGKPYAVKILSIIGKDEKNE